MRAFCQESEGMNLTTGRQKFAAVTEQTLEEVFADDTLRGEFVILETDKETFLQAGGEGDGPYTMEYKEIGNQFQAEGELTKEQVKEAFLDYLRGGSVWRTKHRWRESASRTGCFKQAASILLLLGVATWLLIW
jgi:hypothetical protein